MRRINIYVPGFLLILLLINPSCIPDFDTTVDELDLAITTYDETQDFSAISTFYLADTIIYITDDDAETQREDNATEQHVLDQIRKNLLDIGWVEESDTTDDATQADVAILVSVLEADIYYYYTYWWDWWYWYPWDWWYPGLPGYPGYPGYPSFPVYGYTVGSLMIDMVNMDEVILPPVERDPSVRLPIVWNGVVNGILAGSDEYIQSRLTRQIRQVFYQSDYLHKVTIN